MKNKETRKGKSCMFGNILKCFAAATTFHLKSVDYNIQNQFRNFTNLFKLIPLSKGKNEPNRAKEINMRCIQGLYSLHF